MRASRTPPVAAARGARRLELHHRVKLMSALLKAVEKRHLLHVLEQEMRRGTLGEGGLGELDAIASAGVRDGRNSGASANTSLPVASLQIALFAL